MRQKIEYEIEWPEVRDYRYYVAPIVKGCNAGGFWRGAPVQAPCHVVFERPREVCNRWWARGPYRAIIEVEEDDAEFWCALDPGHDGPCMMELGRAE